MFETLMAFIDNLYIIKNFIDIKLILLWFFKFLCNPISKYIIKILTICEIV